MTPRPSSGGWHLGLLLLLLITSPVCAMHDTTLVRSLRLMAHRAGAGYRTFEGLLPSGDSFIRRDPMVAEVMSIADTTLSQRAHAHALLQRVLSEQRFLESLDALSEVDLPIGIAKSGGAADYMILIDRMEFTRDGAMMDVYVSLALPQTGSRMAFHGRVPLSAQGGIAGNARIYLIGDHRFTVNGNALVTIRGTNRSYVEFDCTGFLGVNLDAELEFSTDILVPEDEDGNPVDERVRVSFTTYAHTLNDILLSISLPPFQVRGLEGFGFYVNKAYLDWSDLSNPPGIVFPTSYQSAFVAAGFGDLWHGIYLDEVEVRLPAAFARREERSRVSVGLRHGVLDEQGLTGELYVENVIADGDMSGWTYTVDKLALGLVANQPTTFALEGALSLPVVNTKEGKAAAFRYQAHRDAQGQYVFAVDVEGDLKLDLWAADLKLDKGSRVIVTERGGSFYPTAHLNGELSINLAGKGPKARFNSIRFEDMVISTETPHFRPGTFGFGREGESSTLSKYPLVINNISLRNDDVRVGIAFDISVNISGKPEEGSFAGKGGLTIWGKQEDLPLRDENGNVIAVDRNTWMFDKVELTALNIKVNKPKIIELAGEVRFFDENEIYGDGFKGSLRGKIQSIAVQAEALFGRTESFRYWYADALIEMDQGVPLVPGVLSAFGFGGGYYSKMKQTEKEVYTTLGGSPSGITYVPDEHTVGIRAIVLIGTPKPQAMKGDVALEVSINRHGGLNSVTFTGNARFMSPEVLGKEQIKAMAGAAVEGKLTEKLSTLKMGQVYGSVRLHFDNVNDVFHGNLEIYVNVAGGMVRGVSEGNKAGWAVLHFERNDWYIHIGTPDQPLGLEVARIFKSKSYFMLGKNLPGSPPPPPQVSEILGNVNLDYMRDMNALESGMGIAFGLHFLVDTGDLQFLMFYGRFSAGTGLDFMLKDYGNQFHCSGLSGPMGINGWYANGQAYAFVMGKIGIRVNLRFYKGTYDILSIGAAAILQAKGPNPFWMKGMVGGYYKILGGLVKGRCRFEVTIGKDCKPVGEQNLLEEVNLIAGISPAPASREVSVFNTPQIAFNIPVGEVFDITDMENKTHSFRALLGEFVVLEGGRPLRGSLVWNEERDVVVFDADDLLPGNKRIQARARLMFEEKVNGAWVPVRFGGTVVTETIDTNFETGAAPDHIPENNVVVSYPLAHQVNFHPAEFAEGFLQLRDGQPYLFHPEPGWIQKFRFAELPSGRVLDTDLSYDARTRRVNFQIPEGFLPSKTYKLSVVNIPESLYRLDQNVREIRTELAAVGNEGMATLTTNTLEGNVNRLEPKELYTTTFRTSAYRTFREKVEQMSLSPAVRLSREVNVFYLIASLVGDEFIEADEVMDDTGLAGLIRLEAVLQGNDWYDRYVYSLVYDGYPLLGWMKVKRADPERLGVPPVRDVYLENVKNATEVDLEVFLTTPFTGERLVYNVGETIASDFLDLQRQAVNYIADDPTRITPRLASLALQPMPSLRYGTYRVRLNYVIPGLNKISSSSELELFNVIPDND